MALSISLLFYMESASQAKSHLIRKSLPQYFAPFSPSQRQATLRQGPLRSLHNNEMKKQVIAIKQQKQHLLTQSSVGGDHTYRGYRRLYFCFCDALLVACFDIGTLLALALTGGGAFVAAATFVSFKFSALTAMSLLIAATQCLVD
eukprot:scaffold7578_cov147-Skeletonema_marinoi.AAC.3